MRYQERACEVADKRWPCSSQGEILQSEFNPDKTLILRLQNCGKKKSFLFKPFSLNHFPMTALGNQSETHLVLCGKQILPVERDIPKLGFP